MRALLLFLLLASSSVGGASAQVPPAITLDIEPLPLVAPLQAASVANWTANVSCISAVGTQPRASGRVAIVTQPTWAAMVMSPTSFVVDPTTCDASGSKRINGTILATATSDAPAFVPTEVVAAVTIEGVQAANA